MAAIIQWEILRATHIFFKRPTDAARYNELSRRCCILPANGAKSAQAREIIDR
jgi:hypothetical protein